MELLSPSGNLKSAYVAFAAGADAIYIGGKKFSARMSADNFSDEEMVEILNYAHLIDKKVYVTMNTLLFQDEFFEAVEYAKFLFLHHVDGLIIQDVGLAFYLHRCLPKLILHASTQLNCHNIAQAKALQKLGFKRIVIAREANLELVDEIKKLGLEVEVFVHGALCVSYSGNCLMSSFIGNRSGNRGRCAQPCRMRYTLKKNNEDIKDDYLISTKDLMTVDHLKQFANHHVDSLKIEGRLKSEEYIFMTCQTYKMAMNNLLSSAKVSLNEYKDNLQKIFSRNFTKGYIFDENPLNLLNQENSSHQGVEIGIVTRCQGSSVFIKLNQDLSRLDGIRFNNDEQVGLCIEKLYLNNKEIELAHKNQVVEIKNVRYKKSLVNVKVIKTKDYLLNKSLEAQMKIKPTRLIIGKIYAYINKPLILEIQDGDYRVNVKGDIVQEALNMGTSHERIISQLCKTGNYPFVFSNMIFNGSDNIYIPISSLNEIKTRALDRLVELKTAENIVKVLEYEYHYHNDSDDKMKIIGIDNLNNNYHVDNQIIFSKDNLKYHLHKRIEKEINDNYENNLVHFIMEGNNNLIASEYCNITNSYALDAFYSLGFKECILSLELDKRSLKLMIDDFKNRHDYYPRTGIIGYGYISLMIMRSCPIGTAYNNRKLHCQKCHQDKYYLRDRMKVDFPIYGDDDCNIHVLNSKPIYLLDKLDEIEELHISNVYLNFTFENEEDVTKLLENTYACDAYTRGHYLKRAL